MKPDPTKTHVATTWKHNSPFISCRFDPTGKWVFASAEDYKVHRWEIATGKMASLPDAHDSWVRGLAFSKDGKTLITGGFDGQLMWWPALDAEPKPTRKVQAHTGWIRMLDVSPDGKWLLSCGNDHLVKLWNLATGKMEREFAGHESHVYCCAFHPTEPVMLSGDLKGKVHQWNLAGGKPTRSFDAKELWSYNKGQGVDYGGARSIAFSPDRKLVGVSGLYKASNPLGAVNEPIVVLFDWSTGKKVRSLIAAGVRGVAWRAMFHPEGFMIGDSGGSGGGYLLFWKPEQEKEFHKLKLPDTARDMDLHPDGIHIVTTHWDRNVRISKMAAKA